MSEQSKFNQISKQLEDLVNEALPKPGKTVYFESVRPKSRGTTVLPMDRIFDPYLKDGKGDYVDIAYITGYESAKTPGGQGREVLGRIQFTRAGYGRIAVAGGDRQAEQLFRFLFLTNQNGSNKDQPWFVPGKNPVFVQDQPKRKAGDQVAFDRMVRQAMDSIDAMSEALARDIASGLDMPGLKESTELEEIVAYLYKLAKKDPGKVLGLDKNVSVRMKSDIKKAEKLGVVKRNDELKMWVWPDSGERICLYIPEKPAADALMAYFLGSGAKTYTFIRELVEQQEELKSQKKNSK